MNLQKTGNTATARLLMAILALALAFTLMPLLQGAYAAENDAPALKVTGDVANELSFASIKELKNDDAIKAVTKEDVVFHTRNSAGTEETSTVTGITLEDLLAIAGGLKEGKELDEAVIVASDGFTREISADWVLTEDADGNKAMYAWLVDGEKVERSAVGYFEGMEKGNKGYWVDGVVEIQFFAKEPAPEPVVNPIKVIPKNKTYKAKTLKKKSVSYKAITIKNAQGDVTCAVKYKDKKSKKALKFNKKDGKLTVKKGTKKGTYKLTVTVKASGNDEYLPKKVKKTVTVKVKK